MRDYNHDRKIDSHDASVFHNVINNEEDHYDNSSGGCGCSTSWIVLGLLLVIQIVKSGLFTGAFAGLILVICLLALFLIFGCWLESK